MTPGERAAHAEAVIALIESQYAIRLIAPACAGCGAELVEDRDLREAPEGERVECPVCGEAYVRTMTLAGYADRGGVAEAVFWPGWVPALLVVS